MANKDQFGGTDGEFDDLTKQIIDETTIKAVVWGIDPAEIAVGAPKMTRWGVAYGITKNKTNATTAQREETALARKDLAKWMRKYVKRNVYDNPMMNDADVSETGLKPHKTTKTKVTKPDTTPLMAYENGSGHSIDAFYRSAPKTKGNKGAGKPDGVALVEIAVWVGDNPPPDPKDWPRKVTGTKSYSGWDAFVKQNEERVKK